VENIDCESKNTLTVFTEAYRFSSIKDKFKKGKLQWKIKTDLKFLPLLPQKSPFCGENKKPNQFCLLKEKANFKILFFF